MLIPCFFTLCSTNKSLLKFLILYYDPHEIVRSNQNLTTKFLKKVMQLDFDLLTNQF